jgi:UDP-2,4-diacetamido-2,4,6-trideoxy-beta-L-altropyranose hydrolase
LGDSITNKWVFRVASSPEVGGGHVMRCLSIGRELHKYQSVHFLLCNGGEYWFDHVKHYSMTASIYKTLAEVKNKNLLVDGYNFSSLETKAWSEKCKCMAFIDDNNIAPNYANIIISSRMDKMNQKKYKNQTILQGTNYALLASEYANSIPSNVKKVKTILVSCGLIDSNNITGQVLDALSKCNFCGNVNIAIGSNAPYLQVLSHSVKRYHFSVSIVLDSYGLHDLLVQSDMVVGTGGVSLLERMALGKPSVTIIAAENQRNQVIWCESFGATILVDPLRAKFQHNLVHKIDLLLKSEEKRLKMSNKGMIAIDGHGSERVAKCMALVNSNYV